MQILKSYPVCQRNTFRTGHETWTQDLGRILPFWCTRKSFCWASVFTPNYSGHNSSPTWSSSAQWSACIPKKNGWVAKYYLCKHALVWNLVSWRAGGHIMIWKQNLFQSLLISFGRISKFILLHKRKLLVAKSILKQKIHAMEAKRQIVKHVQAIKRYLHHNHYIDQISQMKDLSDCPRSISRK